MNLIDLHCDTIYKLMDDKKIGLRSNDFSIDLERLKNAESLAQTFALFVDTDEHNNAYERCMDMYKRFSFEIESNNNIIGLARNYDEIMANKDAGKMSALLSIEEGAALDGKIENLKDFYDLGVRMITLTWNYKNEIGCPHIYNGEKDTGLTPFGYEVVSKMNNLGMLIDVSHLSDKGFYDVAKLSSKPFIATHSNARSIKNHSRNLNDDMLKVLGEKGGVTGINFCSSFLGSNEVSQVDDMISHIKYISNIAGIDAVAIGTDFDGIGSEVEIKDISEMNKLENRLLKNGFSYEDIEKIYYKNALRVIKDVCR